MGQWSALDIYDATVWERKRLAWNGHIMIIHAQSLLGWESNYYFMLNVMRL